MVFEILLVQPCERRRPKSTYATVSKEWQIFFERHNFHRLVLRQSQITNFGHFFHGRRRGLLRHLWLRIELPEYNSVASINHEVAREIKKHSRIVTRALRKLLNVLSSWEKEDAELTLELSVHSPSDSKHFIPEYSLIPDIYPDPSKEDCTYEDFHAHMSRQRRGYSSYHLLTKQRQRGRIFSRRVEIDETATMLEDGQPARAQVVNKLLIRRQHVCPIEPEALFTIIKSLPGLESISLEAEPSKCPAKRPPLLLMRRVLLPLLTRPIL